MRMSVSRYIDADAIQYRKVCKEEIDGNMRVEYMVFRDDIDDTPTADVVEVVRCKDCKYMSQYEQIKACCKMNSFFQEPKLVSDNDFCSRGERKMTEDVLENVKGEWLQQDGIRCSNCNYKLHTTGLPMYCPNCHADMRGGEA